MMIPSAWCEAGGRNPARPAVPGGHPHPAVDRLADRYLGACAHAQLSRRVVPEQNGFLALTTQKLLQYPSRPLVGTGTPPPAGELPIVRADEDPGTRSNRDGVGVLSCVFQHHTHRGRPLASRKRPPRAIVEQLSDFWTAVLARHARGRLAAAAQVTTRIVPGSVLKEKLYAALYLPVCR